jgi:succinylglutamate desuccinylase
MLAAVSQVLALATPPKYVPPSDAAARRRRVVVVGGTHGNEFSGCFVLERLNMFHKTIEERYPTLLVETLLANPKAHAMNLRFVDDDLNRMFSRDALNNLATRGYEPSRAQAIERALGPKGPRASADCVIDLHTTTSNMGCTLIVNSYSALALRATAFVIEHWSDGYGGSGEECPASRGPSDTCSSSAGRLAWTSSECCEPLHPLRVYLHESTQDEAPYLSSCGRDGITIEVGPTPNGLLRSDVVATTERALRLLLQYLELEYGGRAPLPPHTLPIYLDQGKVAWEEDGVDTSMDSLLPGSMIAASLQDRDFEPLRAGEPLFERLDGTTIPYDGCCGEMVYPIFVRGGRSTQMPPVH